MLSSSFVLALSPTFCATLKEGYRFSNEFGHIKEGVWSVLMKNLMKPNEQVELKFSR
jgi:hypothetical protein